MFKEIFPMWDSLQLKIFPEIFPTWEIFLLILDESKFFAERRYSMNHFFLDKIEAHGNDSHADQDVHGTKYELDVEFSPDCQSSSWFQLFMSRDVLWKWNSRNNITEANGAEGYETEITSIKESPTFPLAKEHSTSTYVGYHHSQAKRYWNGYALSINAISSSIWIIVCKYWN